MLHSKVYGRHVKHPGNVYYALVCRVVLDDPVVTVIGRDNVEEFDKVLMDMQNNNKHALVAELGVRIDRYREFVVTSPSAIEVQYLVALRRTRRYCHVCGQQAKSRTAVNSSTGNNGRPVLFCDNHDRQNDRMITMLPFCCCGMVAKLATNYANGSRFYCCDDYPYGCGYSAPGPADSTSINRKRELDS